MPWTTGWPIGAQSVRANRTTGNANMLYINDTMGSDPVGTNNGATRDHFWNVGADEDGRHRFINSMGFTVGGNPDDPVIGNEMDGVIYLREDNSDSGLIQGFYHNFDKDGADSIYQFIPAFLSGTHNVTSAFTTLVAVPKNVYGKIYMFRTDSNGNTTIQDGFFQSNASVTANATRYSDSGGGTLAPLVFDRSGLNIRVASNQAGSGNDWEYRIIYWAV